MEKDTVKQHVEGNKNVVTGTGNIEIHQHDGKEPPPPP